MRVKISDNYGYISLKFCVNFSLRGFSVVGIKIDVNSWIENFTKTSIRDPVRFFF